MRKLATAMLMGGFVLAFTPFVFAADQEDAAAIVDQAIKAHGGADALNKAQTMVRSGAGTMTTFDTTVPFTDEWIMKLPDKLRMAVDFNNKARVTTVLNGDKGWQAAGGKTMELSADHLREQRTELYVLWLTTLTPLKKDDIKLSTLPEIKVNGEPATGVKATSKNKPDVKLYFDKKTHLLVKVERTVREAGIAVNKADVYSNYKDFDGVKLPTKQVLFLSGRKFTDVASIDYKLKSKIADATFGKP